MIPAPLLALVRYAVVYACGKAVGHGWSFFDWGSDTTDAVVQLAAMGLAAAMAGIGAELSTVRRVLARMKANHAPALLHAANEVVGSDPGLAAAAALASVKEVP